LARIERNQGHVAPGRGEYVEKSLRFPSSSRSTEAIASITRYASRAITLADLHEATTVNGFAIASGNLVAELTPKLVALGSARLEQMAQLNQNSLGRAAVRLTPDPQSTGPYVKRSSFLVCENTLHNNPTTRGGLGGSLRKSRNCVCASCACSTLF
jgi:hypothetical protein